MKQLTIPALSARELAALLKERGACPAARRWAKGKTLRRALAECPNPWWMEWLLYKQTTRSGWLTYEHFVDARDAAVTVFYKATLRQEGLKAAADVYRKYVKVGKP